MKVEIRNDTVVISGYINAVERYSKPIREVLHGKIRTFIERIKAGTFRKALNRNKDVKVLLNHDNNKILASTADGTAKLEEDSIGLRAEVTITDKEVVKKAREGKLSGWSFGFYPNSDELGTEGETETRTLTDIDLIEVSILDDTTEPAYYGTSIETRDNSKKLEVRAKRADEDEVPIEVDFNKLAEVIRAAADDAVNRISAVLEPFTKMLQNEPGETPDKEDEERQRYYAEYREKISKI